MRQSNRWQLGLAVGLAVGGALAQLFVEITTYPAPVLAQVNADPSLGTTVTPNGTTYDITGGTTVGGRNLFHSFGRFDVQLGETANFLNALTIANIFARITGGTASNINGLIQAQGTANLFLMNPSGIIFGPSAQLNIGGSFVATTANAIQFPGGAEFSLTSSVTPTTPLLTVNPSAFLFNQIRAGNIQNRSIAPAGFNPFGILVFGLRVPDGQSLLLLGSEVSLDGGRLHASGGRIELGGLTAPGIVELTVNSNDLRLNFPENAALADLSLVNQAAIDVSGDRAGNIKLYGKQVLLDKSTIDAITVNQNSGAIGIQSSQLELRGRSRIATNTLGSGKGGDINITTDTLFVSEASNLAAYSLLAQGSTGNLTVQAATSVKLDQSSTLGTLAVGTGSGLGTGAGGNVYIKTKDFTAQNSGIVVNTFLGQGNAGSLTIDATNSINLVNGNLQTSSFGGGNGGDISMNTQNLSVRDGSFIQTSTRASNTLNPSDLDLTGFSPELIAIFIDFFNSLQPRDIGQGKSGNLTIRASTVEVVGGSATGFGSNLTTETVGAGNAGDLTTTTDRLSIRSGAFVSSSTFSTGQGGALNIIATDSVELTGTSPDGRAVSTLGSATSGTGSAGNVVISTRWLFVQGGAAITTSTLGEGQGGNIDVIASDSVELVGVSPEGNVVSALTSGTAGAGTAGNVTIATQRLTVRDGARVTTSTFGSGDAGSLQIQANQLVEIVGTSRIGQTPSALVAGVAVNATGKGGDLRITTDHLNILDSAQVTVSSEGFGIAGDLEVEANSIRLDNQSKLLATSATGNGGNIFLQVQDILLLRHNSQISTTAGTAQTRGDGGNITINAPRGFIVGVKKENSDITANAFTGSGGRVNITAQGIYGLQFRPRLTPFSDITASSEFGISGTVTLNTPDIDPSRGLQSLPVTPVDPSQQLSQECVPRGPKRASSFVITGRGGIASSPTDTLQDESVLADWVSVGSETRGHGDTETRRVSSPLPTPHSPLPPAPIVEAQGWIVEPDGTVILVAEMPMPTTHNPLFAPIGCPDQ